LILLLLLDIVYEKCASEPGIVIYNEINELNSIKNVSITSNNNPNNSIANNNNLNNSNINTSKIIDGNIINSCTTKPIKKACIPLESSLNINNNVITKHDILSSREAAISARIKLKHAINLFEETKEEIEFFALEKNIDIYTAAKRSHIDYIGIAAAAEMNLRLIYPELDPNNLPRYEDDAFENENADGAIELDADGNPIPKEIILDENGNPIQDAGNAVGNDANIIVNPDDKTKPNPVDRITPAPVDPQQDSSSDDESEEEEKEEILERRPWFDTTDLSIKIVEEVVVNKDRRGGQAKVSSRETIMKKTVESAVKGKQLLDELNEKNHEEEILHPNPFPNLKPDPPNDTLNLLWIHGYSGYIRKSLEYDFNGDPLFLSSRHIISMKNLNPKYDPFQDAKNNNWSQRCFSNHQYPITCMSLNSTRDILVTADIIRKDSPSINQINSYDNSDQARLVFWNIRTGCYINSINLMHSNGVQYLDYSSDNKYLLMLMSDKFNTIMILDLAWFKIVHVYTLGDDFSVYDIKFTNSNSVYTVATSNGVKFFINEEGSYIGSIDGFLTFNCYKGAIISILVSIYFIKFSNLIFNWLL
jgi:hypothetical protein